ncbi:putative DUF1624 domain-containing protein [Azospirillaceae bacterium]
MNDATQRLPIIDAARGVALVGMIFYHFCWDLTFFRLTTFDLLNDFWWLTARTTVVCSFLFLVGVNLVFAGDAAFQASDRALSAYWTSPAFVRRLAIVAACAGAITVVSRVLFPDQYIFFGVLHHIVLASALGGFIFRAPWFVLLGGALFCWAAPKFLAGPMFNSEWLVWLGLMSRAPSSNDFVPLAPWWGMVLLGMGLARWFGGQEGMRRSILGEWAPESQAARYFCRFGRMSLCVYMIHQPLLIAVLAASVWVSGGELPFGGEAVNGALPGMEASISGLPERANGFLSSCQVSCEKNGGTMKICATYCRCVVVGLSEQKLWFAFLGDRLDKAGKERFVETLHACSPKIN